MPRYNKNGQLSLFARDWFDDTRTVFQDCSTGKCRIVLSDGTLMKDAAANIVTGGGGMWAAWLKHPDGSFDMLDRKFSGAVPGNMSPDGAYVLKLNHFSTGPYDVLERDGSRWRLSDADVYAVQLLGGRKAIWMGMDRHVRTNFGAVVPDRLVWGARYNSGVFLTQDIETGQLVLDGHVLRPAGDYHFYDFYWDGSLYHVAYAPTEADAEAIEFTISRADLMALPLVGAPKPVDPPKPEDPPKPVDPPKPEVKMQAPNKMEVLLQVMHEHPEIDTKNEDTRGRVIDYFCAKMGGFPWGRKARNRDGSNKNTDGITYRRSDGRFEIIDAISGATGAATWDHMGDFADGENGFWAPAEPVDVKPDIPKPDPKPDSPKCDCEKVKKEMLAAMAEMAANLMQSMDEKLAALPKTGKREPMTIKVSTNKVWGHAHESVFTIPGE